MTLPHDPLSDQPTTPTSPGGWNDPSRALITPDDPADAPGSGARAGAGRRRPADPVRELMHRHHDLCARAVDPLEIAAGLEAHGVTDRTAARFRHRDVFGLAEELYARVPRAEESAAAPAPRPARGTWALWPLPGALCAATAWAVLRPDLAPPAPRAAAGAFGTVLVAVALWLCLSRGPLRIAGRGRGGWLADLAGPLCLGWLLGYAACGDWLLTGLVTGERGAYDPARAAGTAVVLALAVAPAAGCARWFALRARRRLTGSRGVGEFATRVRPLFALTALGFLAALAPLVLTARLVLPRPPAGSGPGSVTTVEAAVAALAALLFLARLLAVHGFRGAAVGGLAAACAVEAVVEVTALAARLPGAAPLGEPVARLTAAHGAAVVPAAACAAAALGLLGYACAVLSRASAHGDAPGAPGDGTSRRGPHRADGTHPAPCEAPQ
ncbi:hypothetical protein [Streptomyces cucumeris]|uniref:hypothetical protein n=1 Tax=Streptomyces cucumeris TaxID=2962890 RepID=UPI0020C8DC2B|nr:hypothetical protein [Streptomyces sp. NEAU-Y11]MCP9206247.1 hypothetical protein [Streptomyces sp. NEAU-Y11]